MNETAGRFDQLLETPGVRGVFSLSADGFLLQSLHVGGGEPEATAATSAIVKMASDRIGSSFEMGNLRWVLLEFRRGKVLLTSLEDEIWAVVTERDTVLGELLTNLPTLRAEARGEAP